MTDRLEEMAREWLSKDGGVRCWVEHHTPNLTALLRQVQRETREATLEQAARFIETKRPSTGAIEAQAIRALSPEKSPKKPTVMDALIANVSRETSPEQEKS